MSESPSLSAECRINWSNDVGINLYRRNAGEIRYTDAEGVTWRVIGVPLTKRDTLRRLLHGKSLFTSVEM